MNRITFSLCSALLIALSAGCGTTGETNQTPPTTSTPQTGTAGVAPVSATPQPTVNNATPVMPATGNNPASAQVPMQAGAPDGATPSVTTPTPSDATRRETANAKDPTPITTGANDFYLFTSVRSALANDAELKNANIIADVRDGTVTLSGTITDSKHKARAEEIARGVQGVKKVAASKLRVAAAAPAQR